MANDTTTYPVSNCIYSGPPASVAGHVSGKREAAHDWERLGLPSRGSRLEIIRPIYTTLLSE